MSMRWTKTVGSAINLARQYSVAKRRFIAVIMPGPLEDSLGIPPGYYYACLRLAYVNQTSSGSYNFDGWLEDSKWD